MLVLTREVGQSLSIRTDHSNCLVTLIRILAANRSVSLLISSAAKSNPGVLESHTVTLTINGIYRICDTTVLGLVEVRENKVRISIEAPEGTIVHRFEVEEAIARAGPNRDDDEDSDEPSSRVPRPKSPKPPNLNVRLEEPQEDEDLNE